MRSMIVLSAVLTVVAGLTLQEKKMLHTMSAAMASNDDSSMGCQMCQLAVKTWVDSADKNVNAIKKTFDDECKKLFHDIPFAPELCKNYVDTKLDPIIKELEGGTASKDVCKKLGECKK